MNLLSSSNYIGLMLNIVLYCSIYYYNSMLSTITIFLGGEDRFSELIGNNGIVPLKSALK